MSEITDPNCIIKAFQNNNILILKDSNNKYYFRGSDVANAIGITNIRSSIQNYTDKEKGVRKVDTLGGPQDIIFLTSHGVYRLLYSSKKKEAEEFREWVGDILDDIFFNQSKELTKQLKEYEKILEQKEQQLLLKDNELNDKDQQKLSDTHDFLLSSFKKKSICYLIFIACNLYKFGNTDDLKRRLSEHQREIGKEIKLVFCIESKDNELLEQNLKDYLRTTNYRRNQIINEQNQTELIEIDDISIIQNKLIELNKKIEMNKEVLQLELKNKELELKDKELEIQKAKNEELYLQLQLKDKIQISEFIESNEEEIIQADEAESQELQEELQEVQESQEELQESQEEPCSSNTPIKLTRKEYNVLRQRKYRASEKYKQKTQSEEFKVKERERYQRRKLTETYHKTKKEYYNNNKDKIKEAKDIWRKKHSKTTLVQSEQEKNKFINWISSNIKQENNKSLIWNELLCKYLNYETSPIISKMYKEYCIEYLSKNYPNIKTDCIRFQLDNISHYGFKNFTLS